MWDSPNHDTELLRKPNSATSGGDSPKKKGYKNPKNPKLHGTWSSNFFLKQIPHKVDLPLFSVCFHILESFQTSWVGLSGSRTGHSGYRAPTNLSICCHNTVWLQSCWVLRKSCKLGSPTVSRQEKEESLLAPRQKQPFQWVHLLTGPSLPLDTSRWTKNLP